MTRQTSDVIAIIQPFVPNYRKPLFDAIDVELRRHGLRLEVWHDFPKGRVAARGNATSGSWSVPIKQRRLSVGRRNLTYRNVVKRARQVRAVVAGLASTNLETYALALDPGVRLMLWGHGRNFTASNHALDGTIESWLANRAAQVFTYTDAGKKHVVARGLNEDRVTVVVNSTDTRALREAREATRGLDPSEVRNEFGLGDGPVLLFVGAFDAPKQLPFLFDAMDLLVERLPNIQLVLAGAGPDEAFVRKAVEERPYAHLIGRLEAEAFGRIAHIVELVVMPGRVGLVAVDALALGLPVATTRYPFHAPEVDYLVEGANSVWADFDIHAYANLLQAVLSDTDRLAALQVSAGVLGRDYSVEASASRFVSGLLDGLAHS